MNTEQQDYLSSYDYLKEWYEEFAKIFARSSGFHTRIRLGIVDRDEEEVTHDVRTIAFTVTKAEYFIPILMLVEKWAYHRGEFDGTDEDPWRPVYVLPFDTNTDDMDVILTSTCSLDEFSEGFREIAEGVGIGYRIKN